MKERTSTTMSICCSDAPSYYLHRNIVIDLVNVSLGKDTVSEGYYVSERQALRLSGLILSRSFMSVNSLGFTQAFPALSCTRHLQKIIIPTYSTSQLLCRQALPLPYDSLQRTLYCESVAVSAAYVEAHVLLLSRGWAQ